MFFLPLFVEVAKGEDFEAAVRRTDYGSIWEVLQALSEQDEDLHHTIQHLRQEKGRNGQFELQDLTKFVEILPDDTIDINLQRELKKSIAVSILDRIGSNWDEMYGKLCAFKKEHGHCNVPNRFSKDASLGAWIHTQRMAYKNSKLSQKKIMLLNKIGHSWDPFEESWNKMYNKLSAFQRKYKHCNVLHRWPQNISLGSWVHTQRMNYKKKKLPQKKIILLNKIEFSWDPMEEAWNTFYQKLKEYKNKHKNCNIPYRYIHDKSLANWVKTQRINYKKKKLPQKKIMLLDKIGFSWDPMEEVWNTLYHKLQGYRDAHGHCNIPQGYVQDKSLATWINTQRINYKKKKLSRKKIMLLNKIGFSWNPIEEAWNTFYQKLKEYKNKHKNCNVPYGYIHDKSLANWVKTQRTFYRRNHLSSQKIKLLKKIGFEWGRPNPNS